MYEHIGEISRTPEERLFDEKLKDRFFERIVEGAALDVWEKDMVKAGYDAEDVDDFRETFTNLDSYDQQTLLATPFDLRNKVVPHILHMKKSKGVPIATSISNIIENYKKTQRRIAYHTSAKDIVPKEKRIGSIKDFSWGIDGTEIDHRDEDRPMAYYSFNYKHLYREKNPKYLYLVASSLAPNSGHRTDGSEWGRANKLDIIGKLDIADVDERVEEMMSKYKSGQRDEDLEKEIMDEIKNGHNLAA